MSALGKILEFQSELIDGQQSKTLADTWVQSLPILEDTIEAVKVHAQLLRFLEKQDPRHDFLSAKLFQKLSEWCSPHI